MCKTRVLIVDDNKDFRTMIAKYLEGNVGITIIGEAGDGYEAIKIINEKDVDVILLDIIMPRADGLYVLEEMKKISSSLISKTIIISALTQESIIKRTIDFGVSFYMAKPFSCNALLSNINIVMGRSIPNNNSTNSNNETMNEHLHNLLVRIGIPEQRAGFRFLRYAIKMALDNPDVINHIMKELYPEVGKCCGTTAINVERAMRNTIELAWKRGEKELCNIFGYKALSIEDKPTNGEFISRIAKAVLSKNY